MAHQALQKGGQVATHFQHQLLKGLLCCLPDPAIMVLEAIKTHEEPHTQLYIVDLSMSAETIHIRCFGDTVREARLRWFEHVQKKDGECIGRRMLMLGGACRRPGGSAVRRVMDGVKVALKSRSVSKEARRG